MKNRIQYKNIIAQIIKIFSKKKFKKYIEKHRLYKTKIKIDRDKFNYINVPKNRNITISIFGSNNKIEIDKELDIRSCINIFICGNDNIIKIGKAHAIINLSMGSLDNREIFNSEFTFGDSYSGPISYSMMENNTKITIGDNCMFSFGIEMRCSDDHTVFDNNSNKVLNMAQSIEIGNHVWICKEVLISKNTTIPDGCIVGARSVVAKRFNQKNICICGNPARIVKENIGWDGERPDKFNESNKK